MTKKIVAAVLVVCLITNFVSCYSTKTVIVHDASAPFPQYESITVHAREGTVSTFKNGIVTGKTFIGKDERGNTTEMSLDDISYFELTVRELDTIRTALTTVGALVAGAALFVFIVVLVASCPHVSSFDGNSWILEAEPNGGAITKSTEYTDHSVLRRLKATGDGAYRVRLENNRDEIDFNNEIKLQVIDHDPRTGVVFDVAGNLLTVGRIERPYYAMTDGGVDLLKRYGANGKLFWDGDREKTDYDADHPRDEIYLKFERSSGVREGVLVFEGSTTFWSTYIMADFLSRFGSRAEERFKKLESDPAGREKVERFMKKSGYFIEVLLKSGDGWKSVGHLRTAGSYVSKVQALQIDLGENSGETIEIKLRYAPLFWNIIDFGMGFTGGSEQLHVTEIAPVAAIDSKRGDIRELLLERDDSYYRAERGDRAELSFQAPPSRDGLERTLVLKTSGYYNFILDREKELPFLAKAWQLVKKQGIDGYSLEKFREIRRQADF